MKFIEKMYDSRKTKCMVKVTANDVIEKNYLSNYLTVRKQFVKVGNEISDVATTQYIVP